MQRRTDKQTSSQKLGAAAGIKLNGGCRPLLKGLYVTLLSPNLSFAGAGRAGRGWRFRGDVRCSDWYASEALREITDRMWALYNVLHESQKESAERLRNEFLKYVTASASNLSILTGSRNAAWHHTITGILFDVDQWDFIVVAATER